MEIVIKAEAKEIAALVLAVQERQGSELNITDSNLQELAVCHLDRAKPIRGTRASREPVA